MSLPTLRDVRKKLQMTQVEVAVVLNYTQAAISKKDTKIISLEHLDALIKHKGGDLYITIKLP